MRGTDRSQWLVNEFTTYNKGKDRVLILGELVELINLLIETDEIPSLMIIPMYLNNLSMSCVSFEDECFSCREVKGIATEHDLKEEIERLREQPLESFSEEEVEIIDQTIHLVSEDDVASFQQLLIDYVDFLVDRALVYYERGMEEEEEPTEGIVFGYLLFQVIIAE